MTSVSGANAGLSSIQLFNAVPAFVYLVMMLDLPANSFESKSCAMFYPIEVPPGWSFRLASTAALLSPRALAIGWEE